MSKSVLRNSVIFGSSDYWFGTVSATVFRRITRVAGPRPSRSVRYVTSRRGIDFIQDLWADTCRWQDRKLRIFCLNLGIWSFFSNLCSCCPGCCLLKTALCTLHCRHLPLHGCDWNGGMPNIKSIVSQQLAKNVTCDGMFC